MAEHIKIHNNKSGDVYKIPHIKDYNVEQDIDIPGDHFQFVIGNNNYEISNVIGAGDKLEFFVDNKLTLTGYIDDININYSIDNNDITIIGRDLMAILLDNDAEPKTYNNLGLKDYMAKVLPKYGITKYDSTNNTKFDKIVVSPGENEYSVIERLSKERGIKPIYLPDGTFKCMHLNTNGAVTSSSSSSSSSTLFKKGDKARVSKNNAPAFRDSYGTKARPWADQARAAGISYDKLLYVVNERSNYIALGKNERVSSAIAWVRKSDASGANVKPTPAPKQPSTESNYLFSNDNEEGAIRVKNVDVTISSDVVSEVKVYGGDYEKNKNITGIYKDSALKINKKRIFNEADIENKSDAEKRAKEEFYNLNKDSLIITITTTTKQPILINNTARVKIKRMGLNCLMLVHSVRYEKNIDVGSITIITLKMIQGTRVNFKNNTIPLLPVLEV